MTIPDDAQWAILQARGAARSFYGVVTTGIVCRSGCPARTPLRKNVKLFGALDDALQAGFRTCKRCKPMAATPENSQST